MLHAFRLEDLCLLARGSAGPEVRLVLPDPAHAGSRGVASLERPEDLPAAHLSTIVWSSRVWPG